MCVPHNKENKGETKMKKMDLNYQPKSFIGIKSSIKNNVGVNSMFIELDKWKNLGIYSRIF